MSVQLFHLTTLLSPPSSRRPDSIAPALSSCPSGHMTDTDRLLSTAGALEPSSGLIASDGSRTNPRASRSADSDTFGWNRGVYKGCEVRMNLDCNLNPHLRGAVLHTLFQVNRLKELTCSAEPCWSAAGVTNGVSGDVRKGAVDFWLRFRARLQVTNTCHLGSRRGGRMYR